MKSMTPDSAEAVNAKIAVLCGWKWGTVYCGIDGSSRPHLTPPSGNLHEKPPNYSGSLDAMHEAEKALTKDERHQYYLEACRIINEANRETPHWAGASPFHYMTMTAAQRAAAFLTTKTRTN